MKTLYLVRHAKSSWKDESLSDFERPLNKRGKRDAPFMGKLMKQQGIKPDILISSPANRALTTAKIFCNEIGYPFEKLIIEPKLYMASSQHIFELVKNFDDKYESVMLFSHNPGLTSFVNIFLNRKIDNIPTCGIAALQIDIEYWEEIQTEKYELLFFEYPKKYFVPE